MDIIPEYSAETGLPMDESYLEKGLPAYLEKSLTAMKASWAIEDNGGTDLHWDCYWCELNADINSAEVDELISHKQADYLRRQYLRFSGDVLKSFRRNTIILHFAFCILNLN